MKDVQQQHLLFKTTSRMSELFPKTLVSLYFVCSFVFFSLPLAFEIHRGASKQDSN